MRQASTGGRRARRGARRLAVIGMLGAAVACGVSAGESAERHVVAMEGFAFGPDTLRVAVADTVVWINRDVVPHTASASEWDSGPVAAGGSWELVALAPDTVDYVCTLHPTMTGALIIE